MADGGQRPTRRFSAFISYSSADAGFARRLHRRLETYRLPRRLTAGDVAAAPQRLKPLFRDVDDLTASHDLSAAVREALAQSDYLIVVCSPRTVASEWVGREIEYFRAVHGDGNILAALIEGDPTTSFPPALLRTAAGKAVEPLAADFRKESGFRRLGMLKLVAALADVELDQLVQRDAQRTTRRIALAAVASVAVLVMMMALGWMTLEARADAARQRQQASGLVDFVITEVRKELERVGRLEQLADLDVRAMGYFEGEDLRRLSEVDLSRRAKILHNMGATAEKLGRLEQARAQFEEAYKSTDALLAAKPSDPDRIFDHAQSAYWVGFIHLRANEADGARRGFEDYAVLARRLTAIDPNRPEWRMEVAYAENNLGIVALRMRGDVASAQKHFAASTAIKESLAAAKPNDIEFQRDLANGYAWMAHTSLLRGDTDLALRQRAAQKAVINKLVAKDPGNRELQVDLLGYELALARIDASRDNYQTARKRLHAGEMRAMELLRGDPNNRSIARNARAFALFEAKFALDSSIRRPMPIASLGSCSEAGNIGERELVAFCKVLQRRAAGRGPPVDLTEFGGLGRSAYTPRWGISLAREASLK